MATGKGVDFSPRWQKDTPIPAGVEYAWIKVADGSAPYRTVAPDAMVQRFRARGIPMGGYSYAQPGDGTLHARVLIAECRRLGIFDLVPVTDIESDKAIHVWGTAEAIAYGKAFANECNRQGYRPGVYMNASMAHDTRPDQWGIPNLVIWIARYGAKPEALTSAGPGAQYLGRYDVHQYTSAPVDYNQAYTNRHWLSAGGNTPAPVESTDTTKDEAHMITLPASASDTRVVLPLPGVPCRIVIAPGVADDGGLAEVFTAGVELYAGYSDSEGNPTYLDKLMPEDIDSEGVGHIQSPAYLAVSGYQADALGGIFTYSSTKPFMVAIYRV